MAAFYDFREEAKQKLQLPDLEVNALLGAELSNTSGIPVPVPRASSYIARVFIL